ncbi:hypothetical protein SAMD00019534_115500, partial [Acytostelium subglobosum LB1]|uniref:hypothetical protein n=1 Tax=Acytostelium subglobosum LB1 TaxID=1410327 RepID=UPI0006447DAB
CDIQHKFIPLIHDMPRVLEHAQTLVKGCQGLKSIPIIGTEQYPQGLGKLVDQVNPSQYEVYPKTLFSMYVPSVKDRLKTDLKHVKSVILTGIETHVCILQTTLDLLEDGYEVHVVEDAVSSQRLADKVTAIERMRQSGAFITSTESVLFQLVKDAKDPLFKNVSVLMKDHKDRLAK